MKNKSMALMREAMMHFLYTHFLLNTSVADSQLQLNQDPNFNDYQLQKVTLILTKLHHILNMISQHMKID